VTVHAGEPLAWAPLRESRAAGSFTVTDETTHAAVAAGRVEPLDPSA
jgi:sulfate adenylyltransferase subunit 1 (EFTu-like GTPase family)